MTKIFVLDTNVILHDPGCIHQFADNDLAIPIAVLEELDNFKKGNETVNYHAREFVRQLDELSGSKLVNGGASLGRGLGRITVRLEDQYHDRVRTNFSPEKLDHQILNVAYCISISNPSRKVVLVTKDVNLRMKAKSLGLRVQDYRTDIVQDLSVLYTGHRVEENVSPELIDELFSDYIVSPDDLDLEYELTPNEYLILRSGRKSALAAYEPTGLGHIRTIRKTEAYGIVPKNAEQTFALDALMNPDVSLVTISGKAGTGKTLLALAAALERRRDYRQIFMARPLVALSNKEMGYLPGDLDAKLGPYMQPLYDNLGVIRDRYSPTSTDHQRITKFLDEEKLIISPLAYIRGRSLVNIYFIVDEAQNLTPHEVKTIITRAGAGTKIVFTGDIFQIDHPYLDSHSNGLCYLIEKMQGQKLYAHINLEKGERSELADLASELL